MLNLVSNDYLDIFSIFVIFVFTVNR